MALTEGSPATHGRTWDSEDYATRDAALAALGVSFGRGQSRANKRRN